MTSLFLNKPVMIFGCGNPLFGDDGFGPAVVDYLLAHYSPPDHVLAMDAGTAVRDYLFDILLSPVKPEMVFIVDAVKSPGRRPGELFLLDPDSIPADKSADFSLHQFPSVHLLKEMQCEADVAVHVLVVQADHIPDRVEVGLSPAVTNAVAPACKWLITQIGGLESICLTCCLHGQEGSAEMRSGQSTVSRRAPERNPGAQHDLRTKQLNNRSNE